MSHAYVFHGPSGIGKRLFARTLAQCLLCSKVPDEDLDACGECANCRQMAAGTHPDLLQLGCPEGKAIFPIELIAGRREQRGREGLCHDIAMRPTSGDHRVAVIDDADRFSPESGNALLKTLEEPPSYATLILLAENSGALLSTIRSRSQLVRFHPLSEGDTAELLAALGWTETADEADAVAGLCDGSLTTAARLLDPDIRRLRETIRATLSQDDYHSAQVADAILETIQARGDTPAQRKAAGWVVRFCIEFFAAGLRDIGETDAERLELLGRLIDRAAEAERNIAANVQVALCLHALFDDINHLRREARVLPLPPH